MSGMKWISMAQANTVREYTSYVERWTGRAMTPSKVRTLERAVSDVYDVVMDEVIRVRGDGYTAERAGEMVFNHHARLIARSGRGLGAEYSRARMAASAAYASSPESEAYWVS